MNYHRIVEVYVYPSHPLGFKTKPTKYVNIIAFADEDLDLKAEKRLKELYGWDKGFHYNYLETKVVSEEGTKSNNNLEMAKTTAKATTDVAVFEEQAKGLTLPVIPKEMIIGGITFSEESIKKEVDAVKKISIEVPLDTDTKDILDKKKKDYEEMKTKKNAFVKTRTAPETFRTAVMKPINAWGKGLKAQIDAYGALAIQGENHCLAEMKKYEDWETEQANKQRLAEEQRLKDRSQQLSNLQGVRNFESGHWTFPWGPEFIVEESALTAEFGWDDEFAKIQAGFEAYQKEEEARKQQASVVADALVSSRAMLLEMMQYSKQGDNFLKNGHVLTLDKIKTANDAEFKELLNLHNTPVQQASTPNPFSSPQTVPNLPNDEPQKPQGFGGSFGAGSSTSPFAAFGAPANTDTAPAVAPAIITEWPEGTIFVEYALTNTVLRVYPTENLQEAQVLPEGKSVGFSGALGLNLHFIIYK